MLTPLTENQKTRIINNVVKACTDIDKLNKQGYDFLYLASGFIAHYNRYGFIDHYKRYSLAKDILENALSNQWHNFREGERDYDYYMSKKDVYNGIIEKLTQGKIQFVRVGL